MRRLLYTWKETSSLPPAPSDFAFAPPCTSSQKLKFERNLLDPPVFALEKHPVIEVEESEV